MELEGTSDTDPRFLSPPRGLPLPGCMVVFLTLRGTWGSLLLRLPST